MAIYKRERNFQSILQEIAVERIPLRFVRDITCSLSDGSVVVLNEVDFEEAFADDVECLIKELEYVELLQDFQIRIDFSKVETNVSEEVTELLHKINNDQGNSSM